MVKILFTNQFCLSEDEKIEYEFEKDNLKMTYKGRSESLNFEGLPNGKLNIYNEKTNERLVKHKVGLDYLISAEKIDNVLHLELLNHIPENATMEEKFPVEIDYREYKKTPFGKERENMLLREQEKLNKEFEKQVEKKIKESVNSEGGKDLDGHESVLETRGRN